MNISRREFFVGAAATAAATATSNFRVASAEAQTLKTIQGPALKQNEVRALQEIVGTTPDGAWGPNSAASYRNFIKENDIAGGFQLKDTNQVYWYNPEEPRMLDLNVAQYHDNGTEILSKHGVTLEKIPNLKNGSAPSQAQGSEPKEEKSAFDQAVEGVKEKASDQAKETGENALERGLNSIGDSIEEGIGSIFGR